MLLNGSNFTRDLSLLFVLAVLCELCGGRFWVIGGEFHSSPPLAPLGLWWRQPRTLKATEAGLETNSGFTFVPEFLPSSVPCRWLHTEEWHVCLSSSCSSCCIFPVCSLQSGTRGWRGGAACFPLGCTAQGCPSRWEFCCCWGLFLVGFLSLRLLGALLTVHPQHHLSLSKNSPKQCDLEPEFVINVSYAWAITLL